MGSSKISSNDVHRLYLQAVMSRRIMSEELARKIWVKCVEAVESNGDLELNANFEDNGWHEFCNKLHAVLDPFDLEFKTVLDHNSNTRLCALVNRKDDDAAQLASDYTPHEIAFFKAVVEQIMLAPNHTYSVSSMAALREVRFLQPQNMSKSHAEGVLASFVARGWMVKSKRGRYSLAPRSWLELGGYLEKYADEYYECVMCSDIVFNGCRCATPNCQVFAHSQCREPWRRQSGACPSCKAPWGEGNAGTRPVGEGAFKEGSTEKRRTLGGGGGANGTEEMDESQEMMSQTLPDDSQPTQTQSQSQSTQSQTRKDKVKKGGRGKKRQETPLSNEEGEQEHEEERADDAEDDDAMDIDNLPTQEGGRSSRIRRRQ